jgi:hypothetical protein
MSINDKDENLYIELDEELESPNEELILNSSLEENNQNNLKISKLQNKLMSLEDPKEFNFNNITNNISPENIDNIYKQIQKMNKPDIFNLMNNIQNTLPLDIPKTMDNLSTVNSDSLKIIKIKLKHKIKNMKNDRKIK